MIYLLVNLKTNKFKASKMLSAKKAAKLNRELRRAGKTERWLSNVFSRQTRAIICRELLEAYTEEKK